MPGNLAIFTLGILALLAAGSAEAGTGNCVPTAPDALGPFYKPDAPVRPSVGTGYLLSGRVMSATDCRPLEKARIEFWLTNERGDYDDAHRATVIAGAGGRYRFESNYPAPYRPRPSHIHIRVTAPGHRTLITQHYPKPQTRTARFDLVLRPDR